MAKVRIDTSTIQINLCKDVDTDSVHLTIEFDKDTLNTICQLLGKAVFQVNEFQAAILAAHALLESKSVELVEDLYARKRGPLH